VLRTTASEYTLFINWLAESSRRNYVYLPKMVKKVNQYIYLIILPLLVSDLTTYNLRNSIFVFAIYMSKLTAYQQSFSLI
jgi:hypothetical protein